MLRLNTCKGAEALPIARPLMSASPNDRQCRTNLQNLSYEDALPNARYGFETKSPCLEQLPRLTMTALQPWACDGKPSPHRAGGGLSVTEHGIDPVPPAAWGIETFIGAGRSKASKP